MARGYGLAKALGNLREEQIFLLDTAQLHIARKNFGTALERAEEARALTPDRDISNVPGVLATCLLNLDRFDEAQANIAKGLERAAKLDEVSDSAFDVQVFVSSLAA
ncbi:MAG: hypothetical protein NXI24_13995 [bacterium]|nr:hypothetical protein [bacterium]